MLELNKIYNYNCLEGLKQLDNESVDCVITSPPYWGLRAYDSSPVIWDAKENCIHVWEEIEGTRKLGRDDGYWGGEVGAKVWKKEIKSTKSTKVCSKCGAWLGELGLEPEKELYIKHLCDIFDEIKRVLKKTGTIWVNLGDTYSSDNSDLGSLSQIPSLFSIEMTNRKWRLRNEIIWFKRNALPSSLTDRFTVDFEKIFFFTKNKNYYFEKQFEPYSSEDKVYDVRGRNKRCIWDIPLQPLKEDHYASYPPKLVETCLLAGCPKDGIVLDPFMGSGTTACVAKEYNRNFIGFEINPKYIELSERRLKGFFGGLF